MMQPLAQFSPLGNHKNRSLPSGKSVRGQRATLNEGRTSCFETCVYVVGIDRAGTSADMDRSGALRQLARAGGVSGNLVEYRASKPEASARHRLERLV